MKRKHEEEKKEIEAPAKKEEKKEEEIPAPATKKVKKPKVSDELVSGCKAQIEKVIAKNGGVKPEESALHDVMLALFEKAYAKANK